MATANLSSRNAKVDYTSSSSDGNVNNRRSKLNRASTPELERAEQGPPARQAQDNAQWSKSTAESLKNGRMCDIADLQEDSSCEILDLIEDLDDNDDDSPTSIPKVVKLQQCGGNKEMDVDKYMARREMTPFQERVNAITIMPGAFYCIMFLLSGAWLDKSLVDETEYTNYMGFDDSRCLSSSWVPHLHALPPLPVIAAALGIILHAPFSFMYHWSFAHRLPPGLARTTHWSRRMDHIMIHVCSASMAYATSGRSDFFLVNLLFNLDCCYRQIQKRVRPRRNQVRILISVIGYTIPILRRGDMELFSQLWLVFGVSFWLFVMYPLGGWSHSAFHLVMAFVPPLLMNAAIDLPASQDQLKLAAQCAVMAKQSLLDS